MGLNNISEFESSIIIGLGGCGSAISSILLSKLKLSGVKNVELYLFNTSRIDMEGLKSDEYYILNDKKSGEDSQGCGKDRELGKKIAEDNEDEINNFLQTIAQNKKLEALHIIFGTGGGTGSGFSIVFVELVKKLFGKTIPIFVHGIKPFSFETIPNVNNINNLMDFTTLLANKQIVYNMIDNDVLSTKLDTSDFQKINAHIVDNILLFFYDYLSMNSQAASSFSLDRRDFYRVVSQKGGTAGLVSIYGYKGNKFHSIYNYTGIDNENFEGARKVLCIVKESKYIKDLQGEIKKLGKINVLEFKSLTFDNKITSGQDYQAIVYAIGENKTDNVVDEMLAKFEEAQSMKEDMSKKDEIKNDIKSKNVKKVKLKF